MKKENSEEKIVIRDFRKGDRFQIDNLLIDEYLKLIGANAYSVYNIIARHVSNKTQRAYPGRKIMSEKLGKSIETIDRAIDILKKYNLLRVIRFGNRLNNNYDLLDRTEWKKK